MPVQRIPVRGGFYALADRHWSSQDLLNMISLPSETGNTKTELSLVQAPGPRPFCEFGDGAIRGLRNVEGKLFTVSGTQLYQISATGVAIPRGTIPGVARVSMAHNQYGAANQLVIDNGSARYVFNTVTLVLEKVTDESFPGSFCAFYVDQYLGFVEPQGRYWGHSDLADALNYNSLDTYEAEADPDRIISAFVSHREVLIFGKDTIEPFVNSPVGDGTAPFVRASNTVIECGCAARFSVAGMDNSVFWLDDKRIVRRLDGYTPVRISNAGIEQALAECTPGDISRAFAFVYEDQGFKVYYLTVPGQFTFGYDLRTQEWHRRSSPGRNDWRLSDLVFWEGQWIGGDRAAGRLYILDWDYSFDGTEELVREWDSGSLFADQRRIEINEIEVLGSVGAPTETVAEFPAQPDPPTITGEAPDGDTDIAYTHTYTLADGTPPYVVTLRSGTLPPGLTLSSAGVLSGTPTTIGTSEFTVRVTDANGLWDELDEEVNVIYDIRWDSTPGEFAGAGDYAFEDSDLAIYAEYVSGTSSIRAQSTRQLTGKRYFEFDLAMNNNAAAGRYYIGVHGIGQVTWPGVTTQYVILQPQQTDGTATVFEGPVSTFAVSSLNWSSTSFGTCRTRMAVDVATRTVWIGIGASGAWTDGDPEAGTGGYVVPDANPLYLYGDLNNITSGKQRRIEIVMPESWTWTAPAGFA